MDYKKLLEYRKNANAFGDYLGIEIVEIEKGYAKGKMIAKSEMLNPMKIIHGGCLFTLADTIGGVAACTCGNFVSTVSGNINYLNPARDTTEVTAYAKEVKFGRKVLVCDVELYDQNKVLLTKGTFTYYNLSRPILDS